MAPTRGPRLPQELFNMIIDDKPDDEAMQKNLALVSKSFLTQSRKHFFNSIDFLAADDDARSKALHARFHEILNENPTIATHVREVRVRDISQEFDPPEDERPSWIRDEASFQQTLLAFASNGISRFSLQTDLYWTSFPVGLKRALMEVFLTPSLVYLGLAGMQSFPKSCSVVSRAVQELYLDGVELDEDDDEDIRMPEVGPAVTTWLGFENMEGRSLRILCDVLLPPTLDGGLQHLEILHVGPQSDEDIAVVWDVVNAARASLRQFFWTYTHKENIPPPLETTPINLGVVDNLNWLYFEVTPFNDAEGDPQIDHFSGLLALLASVRPENELRILHVTAHYFDYANAMLSVSEYDGWDRLSVLLRRLPQLDDIRVQLYVWSSVATEDKADLAEHVRLRLAGESDYEEILYVSVIEYLAGEVHLETELGDPP